MINDYCYNWSLRYLRSTKIMFLLPVVFFKGCVPINNCVRIEMNCWIKGTT